MAVLLAFTSTANAADITNPITINDGDTFTVANGDTLTIGNGETLTIEWHANLIIESGGTLIVESGGLISSAGTIENSGNIENEGTITRFEPVPLEAADTLNNYGHIENSGFLFSSSFNNYGTIDNTDQLSVDSMLNSGSGFINNIGAFRVSTYGSMDNFGTINNSGTIDNSYIFRNYGYLDNSGVFDNSNMFINSGTIDNNGTISNSMLLVNSGTISNYGIINNFGTISNQGTINNCTTGIINGLIEGNPVNTVTCPGEEEAPITTCYLTEEDANKAYNGDISASVKTYSDSIVIELLEPVEAGNIRTILLNVDPDCILDIESDNSEVKWIVDEDKGKGNAGFGAMLTAVERASGDQGNVTKITLPIKENCEWDGVLPTNEDGYGIVMHVTRLPGSPQSLWLGSGEEDDNENSQGIP